MESCLFLLIVLVLSPTLYVLNGVVLTRLWQWFLVPLGLPALTVPYAIGLSLIVGFLTHRGSASTKQDNRTEDEKLIANITAMLAAISHPLLVLGIGWIVTLFM